MSEMGDWINQMLSNGGMTRPGGEGPYPAPTPDVYRPPPELVEPPMIAEKPVVAPPPVAVAPVAPPAAYAPPAVAPTSEMGMWIEEMIRRGMIQRAGAQQETAMARGNGPGGDVTSLYPDPYGVTTPPTASSDPNAPPGTTPPGTPAYPGAPPWAGDPNIPAPLEMFLRQYYSGHTVLPQEIYDLYGGDQILEAIRKYDPNARWQQTSQYSGEGGEGPNGYQLVFDERTLPAPAGPLGWSRPTNAEGQGLLRGDMKYYDPIYGWVTDPRNIEHKQNAFDKYGMPIAAAAISMLAPYAAPALFGAMGVPAAAAGFTSAVTGGAAGLAAGSIPGAAAAGAPWWAKPAASSVRTVGGAISGMSPPTSPVAPRPSNPAGVTTPKAASAPLARNQVMADPYGFNPAAFNAGGSTTKPQSNDSKLVATQFADDPYRFS